jgi:protein phosphatase
MKITIPELSLVVLIGASSSGKSTFAAKHFAPTEVISSDDCRALVSDDENALDVNREAFEVLGVIAAARLKLRRLSVIDATSVQREARKPLLELARENDVLPVAIVFDLPESVLQERSSMRPDRTFGSQVIHGQRESLRRSIKGLQREGFRYVFILRSEEQIAAVEIERQRLWTDRRDESGPFDIIGDVHGCHDELIELLSRLGYREDGGAFQHPDGRRAVFLGDLVDRGPATPAVLRTAMAMTAAGSAFCVPGNHDVKLMRALQGRKVTVTHGLAESLAQLEQETAGFRTEVISFIDAMISHLVLDGGNLVVAHAGMNERFANRSSQRVRAFALFGDTTGETDEFGLPVRHDWASDYRGKAVVAYGHTPVVQAEWVNNTICLDTGCVFGGRLSALRYPERETIDVQAARVYYEPVRPLASTEVVSPVREALSLDITDVTGRRTITTRIAGNVTIPEENAAAALEVMSRFALDPRWLIYLPPTMSPPETSKRAGILEHPEDAFGYYRRNGVTDLICEEKHMGSRAVAIVGRTPEVIERTFRIASAVGGTIFTRTGRRFFPDEELEAQALERLRGAVGGAGLWDELETDWLLLDLEILPWSVKAGELLLTQYAAVGSAAEQSFALALPVLQAAADRGIDLEGLLERTAARASTIAGYRDAYRRYCWEVESIDDLRFAPFHILAGASGLFLDRNHVWQMATADRLALSGEPVVIATQNRLVDLNDDESEANAVAWWEALTSEGGEGMVVKPLDFIPQRHARAIQPAVKCRGTEYLRIIYGPEYTMPENLVRLRQRSLGLKRSMATREFALGIEALERFSRGDGLYRVHECVFGVLALESEPVDSRL